MAYDGTDIEGGKGCTKKGELSGNILPVQQDDSMSRCFDVSQADVLCSRGKHTIGARAGRARRLGI